MAKFACPDCPSGIQSLLYLELAAVLAPGSAQSSKEPQGPRLMRQGQCAEPPLLTQADPSTPNQHTCPCHTPVIPGTLPGGREHWDKFYRLTEPLVASLQFQVCTPDRAGQSLFCVPQGTPTPSKIMCSGSLLTAQFLSLAQHQFRRSSGQVAGRLEDWCHQ